MKQTLVEAVLLLALASALGLMTNAVREEGIRLTRNYSPSGTQDHGFQTMTLQEVYDYCQLDDALIVFIDARDEEQYREGHIPGALQFDSYHPDRYLDDILEVALDAETVVFYCAGGDCEDSLLAVQYLTLEIDTPLDPYKVYLFEGGVEAWEAAGYQLVQGSEP